MLNNVFRQLQDKGDPINAKHQTLLANAQTKGKALAQKSLPKMGDSLEPYIGTIRSGYSNLLSEFLRPLAGNHQQMAHSEKENLNNKVQKVEKQLGVAQETERTLNLERDNLPHNDYQTKGNIWLHVVIILLAFGEGIYTKPAFALFDISNNLFQYFILAMLTVFFIFLPHTLVGIFKSTEDSKYKYQIRIGTAVIVLIGFWVLASMRTMFLQNIGSTTMQDVKAYSTLPLKEWCFVGVQCLFLVVTCYCAYLAPFSSREEKKSNGRAKQLDAKLRDVGEQIRRHETELEAIPERLHSSEMRWSQRQTDTESMKVRINAMFLEAINVFIDENVLYRSDHVRPDCFDEPVRPLV